MTVYHSRITPLVAVETAWKQRYHTKGAGVQLRCLRRDSCGHSRPRFIDGRYTLYRYG